MASKYFFNVYFLYPATHPAKDYTVRVYAKTAVTIKDWQD